MGTEATRQLPQIDFSGVDASSPGSGPWAAVRAQVMDALTSCGCFDAHYPRLTAELRARLFDGAVRPLFALPADTKRRNHYGADKPFHGYVGGLPGLDAFESLAIVDAPKPEPVRDFADLMWPDSPESNVGFCETVHGAAARIAELELTVRRMILEALGVDGHFEAQNESLWHLLRMSEYRVPTSGSGEKTLGYRSHKDTCWLSFVCEDQVRGLEMQTRDGRWILLTPSPTSLVVMVGNTFRAWTNGRLHAPFHRVTVSGDAARYSAILFSAPGAIVRAPDELVDDEHPRRFKDYDHDDFVRFCVSEEGGRHGDKLEAYCGV